MDTTPNDVTANDDGILFIDSPALDILVDTTGHAPSVKIEPSGPQELTPATARRLADAIRYAADLADPEGASSR